MEIKKLDLKSVDGCQLNIEVLQQIAPSCITEVKDSKTGELRHVVNFETLREMLGDEVAKEGDEMYEFVWPGKQEARRDAARSIDKTMRPVLEDSVDWDTTKNLYIEGDNLEALKLLQKSYLGKVKMIYIDPPYNTGNDFVYDDDFALTSAEFDAATGNVDDLGLRYRKNSDSNGRFHSDWCSMIYSRLMVARSLLTEDGVIFISIDDNEQSNLKKICDEVFGETNFVCEILREAIRGGSKSKNIRNVHDYVLCYAKNISMILFGGIEQEGFNLDLEDENGPYKKGRELNKWGAGSRREDSPSMFYPIPGPNGEDVYPIRNDGSEGRWRLGKVKMKELIDNKNVIYEQRADGTYIVYEKIRNDAPRTKQFTTWFSELYLNSKGTEELKSLFNAERAIFDYSKPSSLLKDLCILTNDEEAIILDFFSGSATTADAVMQLNAEDKGCRRFIMVQLPEETSNDSEARKAGYKNICEIGKERIRRAGKKIKEEFGEQAQNLDVGFRVLRIDSSNMEDVNLAPSAYDQDYLDLFANNIKADRSDLDLLFGAMLNWGVELSLPMETLKVDGKKVYSVNDGDLVACFANDVDDSVIEAMAKKNPLRVLFRDGCFPEDKQKINLFEKFKQLCDWSEEDAVKNIRVI